MNLPKEKSRLRKTMVAKRKRISPIERIKQNQVITCSFLALPEYASAKVIGFYASKAEEVSADNAIIHALKDGKRVVLPRVEGDNLFWHEIKKLSQLRVGSFAIREPPSVLPRIELQKIDLLVLPCVAFDKQGNRLGFGGGFYDRVLKEFKGVSVGFAFDFQVLDQLPCDSWDQKVSKVLAGK